MSDTSGAKQSEKWSNVEAVGHSLPMLYPMLSGFRDAYWLRISGDGLGNSFFAYFHSVVLAKTQHAQIITPPWLSLKPLRILAGRLRERSYWGTFRAHPDEIRGLHKLALLFRPALEYNVATQDEPLDNRLYRVTCKPFTFRSLHDHRQLIRDRLLAISVEQPPSGFSWGAGEYAAVHVRLGDFSTATPEQLHSGKSNLRIPLHWYIRVIDAIRSVAPGLPICVISDGSESALAPLVDRGGKISRSGSDMGDLFALAGASLLVGSNSTYSRWAAFLGDMPSIWLDTEMQHEKPTARETPIAFVGLEEDFRLPFSLGQAIK